VTARLTAALIIGTLLAGCPPSKPPQTAATVKNDDLPRDVAGLNAWADEQMRKQTPEAMTNALVALDKALTLEKSYESLWRAAKACAWLGDEYDTDNKTAESFVKRGMEYAEQAAKLDPNRVEGHYYRGLTLGQFAWLNKVKARDIVPQVVEATKKAVEADPKFDHAGPLRLLGSVYAQAPEPPTSVGDHEEGIKMLSRAIQIASAYPQNHLLLGDAYRTDKNLDAAERAYQKVLESTSNDPRVNKWRKQAQEGMKKIENLRRQKSSGREAPF
jgi:tetratricopeptide (TPR) repeat protein